MTDAPCPLLAAHKITKRFPGVIALREVDLRLQQAEVLAVIGENGAGKSTLMKILAGIQRPDAGRIEIDGAQVDVASVPDALDLGIALIHQELCLAPNLSVAANVLLGREPVRYGLIDRRRLESRAALFLAEVGLTVAADTVAGELSIGQQQLVEIARALSVGARILIMDEPTSSLTQSEADRLFVVVRRLRDRGVGIVYISHRLGEIEQLADRVTVLRDGENAGQLVGDEIQHDRMVRLMVGRDISQFYTRTHHEIGEPVLRVKELVVPSRPQHKLDFAVRRGELVGLAGLVGAGRTELLEVLFGVVPAWSGGMYVGNRRLVLHSPRDAIDAGLALIPEDRKAQGLLLRMTVRTNVGFAGLARNARWRFWLNQAREQSDTTTMVERLRIRTPSDRQVVQLLSGGNQQKVVLGKWLSLQPRVLLMDEPTRGVDIGAKQDIYALMEQLAEQGVAVLFVSSDMEEILGMADRVLVMHEGRLCGELDREALSEESIMSLATGRAATGVV